MNMSPHSAVKEALVSHVVLRMSTSCAAESLILHIFEPFLVIQVEIGKIRIYQV